MARSNGGKGHILVVEDWEPNVVVVGLMLEIHGYSFEVANEGFEAIKLFEERQYDAVLMDVKLPDISGYEATLWLRQFEDNNNRRPTPIIATTAYAMKGDREKCLSCGMSDYLSKPLDSQGLDAVLQQLIKTSH